MSDTLPPKNPHYCVEVFDRNNPGVVITIDWYDYIEGLRRKGITLSSPVEHASKKMFSPGNRGHKDLAKDLKEIIWGLQTGLRLLEIAETREGYQNE